jgi:NADPH2:quinone reductase
MRAPALPATMRALELRSQEGDAPAPVLVERAVPKPRHGEVLLRMAAAPINPNDLLFLKDRYEVRKPLPVVPGFEGSGTVVAVGGGFVARTMLGRRVACAAGEGDGTWAEYAAVAAMRCIPLRGGIDLDEGATMLTNPLTAWVLVARARAEGHRAIVLTAAAGALGRMLCRLCAHQGLTAIAVVRRRGQVEALRSDGTEHVLDSSAPDFDETLRSVCARLGASLVLDAIAGDATQRLMAAMPPGSTVRVYGMLSSEPCRIDPNEIVFHAKRLEGFTMYEWLRTTSVVSQFLTAMRVQGLLAGVLKTHVQARMKLDAVAEALALARAGATGGKVLLVS